MGWSLRSLNFLLAPQWGARLYYGPCKDVGQKTKGERQGMKIVNHKINRDSISYNPPECLTELQCTVTCLIVIEIVKVSPYDAL